MKANKGKNWRIRSRKGGDVREVYFRSGPDWVSQEFPVDAPAKEWRGWLTTARGDAAKAASAGKPDRGTFAADAALYVASIKGKRAREDEEARLALWSTVAGFGKLRRAQIKRSDCRLWLDRWQAQRPPSLNPQLTKAGVAACKPNTAGYAASTLNKLRQALGRVWLFNDGEKAISPVRGAKDWPAYEEAEPESRWFPDELRSFLIAAIDGAQTRAVLDVLTSTGMRHSELKRLVESDIDFTGARSAKGSPSVEVRRPLGSKRGRVRCIPLDEYGVRALLAYVAAGYIGVQFSNSSVNKSWQRAITKARAAGIQIPEWSRRLVPYDNRHKWASDLRIFGADLDDVGALLGHVPGSTETSRYAHVVQPKLVDAVDRVAAARARAIA